MEQQYPTAQQYSEDSRSLLADATNPAKIIEEFSHRIRGDMFDIGKGIWVNKSKPKLNEQGVNELINEVFSRVNQNTIFSNLSDREVANLIISFGDDLAITMCEKIDEWEMKEEDMDSVFNMCIDIVFMSLKRGFEQGERKFLTKAFSQSEHIVHNQTEQQKRGLLDGVFKR